MPSTSPLSNCACASGYFLGSSRTYYWYANAFDDWCKTMPDNNYFIDDMAMQLCTQADSQYKMCTTMTDAIGSEQYYTYYYHWALGEKITRDGYLINWKDYEPDSCGVLCYYSCYVSDYSGCRSPYAQLDKFVENLDNYYGTPIILPEDIDIATLFDPAGNVSPFSVNELGIKGKVNPYPYEGFVYDFYGIVGQGPGSTVIGPFCDWCFGGLGGLCVDPWFAWRGFESKVFTWGIHRGVPYRNDLKIKKFYEDNLRMVSEIKSNQMADEQISITGAADWNDGNIRLGGAASYGKYLNREASYGPGGETITNGDGSASYVITDLSLDRDEVTFKDRSVLNKNCSSISGIENYSWIYVDIPESTTSEYQDGVWTEVNVVPMDSFLTRAMWGAAMWNFHGIGFAIPILGGSTHYRKYTKKIVKAPHNLYIKSGQYTFVECQFGETLMGLEPGRYYFPNMCSCVAQQNLEPYSPEKITHNIPNMDYFVWDDPHDPDFAMTFSSPLVQFNSNSAIKSNLQEKFDNAVNMIGLPWAEGVRCRKMEDVPMLTSYLSIEQLMQDVVALTKFALSVASGSPDYSLLPQPTPATN